MGRFVNPENSAFQNAVNGEIYIDKTGLIELTNRFLSTPHTAIRLDLKLAPGVIIKPSRSIYNWRENYGKESFSY